MPVLAPIAVAAGLAALVGLVFAVSRLRSGRAPAKQRPNVPARASSTDSEWIYGERRARAPGRKVASSGEGEFAPREPEPISSPPDADAPEVPHEIAAADTVGPDQVLQSETMLSRPVESVAVWTVATEIGARTSDDTAVATTSARAHPIGEHPEPPSPRPPSGTDAAPTAIDAEKRANTAPAPASEPGDHVTAQPQVPPLPQPAGTDAFEIVADARARALEMIAAAEQAGESLLARAMDAAENAALAIQAEARSYAETTVSEAQAKASEILSQAERDRAEFQRTMAHDQALLDEKRRRLSELLQYTVEEVKRTGESPGDNVHDLSEARDLRDASEGTPY